MLWNIYQSGSNWTFPLPAADTLHPPVFRYEGNMVFQSSSQTWWKSQGPSLDPIGLGGANSTESCRLASGISSTAWRDQDRRPRCFSTLLNLSRITCWGRETHDIMLAQSDTQETHRTLTFSPTKEAHSATY